MSTISMAGRDRTVRWESHDNQCRYWKSDFPAKLRTESIRSTAPMANFIHVRHVGPRNRVLYSLLSYREYLPTLLHTLPVRCFSEEKVFCGKNKKRGNILFENYELNYFETTNHQIQNEQK